jgi:hypothetical protein
MVTIGTTYAAMAPKLVARTVFANRAFNVDTSRIRVTIRARRTDFLVTKVNARTGNNCTKQRHIATSPNSAFFNLASENFVYCTPLTTCFYSNMLARTEANIFVLLPLGTGEPSARALQNISGSNLSISSLRQGEAQLHGKGRSRYQSP